MEVGDLVEAMNTHDLKILRGVILKKLPLLDLGLAVFEVMTSDGDIGTYTSAALRPIKQ